MDKFSYEANGYNRMEVNQFISDVITQTEGIIEQSKIQRKNVEILSRKVANLQAQLRHYKELEAALSNAIIMVEDTNKKMIQQTQQEADLIISDAKMNASRIVNEALLKAEKVQLREDILENNIKNYKQKINLMIEEQQQLASEIEVLELDN